MRKFTLAFIALLLTSSAFGQKLIVGEKAPELRVVEWLGSTPGLDKKGYLLEFFYSPSDPSKRRLPELNALARRFQANLDVIVISREAKEKIAPLFPEGSYTYFVALDDNGKTFSGYGVQFVPFSVLVDNKGRVAWFGNSSQLTEAEIQKAIE